VHLVDFIIRIFHDARSSECHKTSIMIATSLVETCTYKKLNIFLIQNTFKCLYAFVGFISTSNKLNSFRKTKDILYCLRFTVNK